MLGRKLLLVTLIASTLWTTSSAATTNFPVGTSTVFDDVHILDQSSAEQSLDLKARSSAACQKYRKKCLTKICHSNNSQSMALSIPHILDCIFRNLKCNDLRNTVTVCKTWSDVATSIHKQLHSMDIIHLDHPWRNDIGSLIIQNYKNRVERGKDKETKDDWRPQLMMIFLSTRECKHHNCDLIDQIKLVQRNCRTFRAAHYCSAVHSFPQENCSEVFLSRRFTGFIFPEALLAQSGVFVDVIFPTGEHLSNGLKLFGGKPDENKKMFQQLYGWKSENPIKLAIVMSRHIPDDLNWNTDGAYQRAKEFTRWLKSFPESESMPICLVLDADGLDFPEPSEKMVPSLSVILFGGSAVQVSAFFGCRDHSLACEGDTAVIQWIAANFKKTMPRVSQSISFLIGFNQYVLYLDCPLPRTAMLSYHNEVFGMECTETDIELLDEKRRIYNRCYLEVGFEYEKKKWQK